MPGACSQTPTPPFCVIIWQAVRMAAASAPWRQDLNCVHLYIQKQQCFAALV